MPITLQEDSLCDRSRGFGVDDREVGVAVLPPVLASLMFYPILEREALKYGQDFSRSGDNLSMSVHNMSLKENRLPVTLTFQAPDLSDERLQTEVEQLLPQLREIAGVSEAQLVSVEEAPENSKSVGGFVLGALKFTIDNSNILKGLLGVGNAIVGNDKTVEISVEAPGGKKYSGKAKNLAELEQVIQLAEASLKRLE